jgi:putative lipoprotein
MAMPANALLTVQLQDVSLADVPAAVIAEQKIEFAGKQVPLPFELHYDRAKIDRSHTYSVSARITVDGQLKFLNTSAHRVITRGNPAQVNVMLQRVATPTDDLKH